MANSNNPFGFRPISRFGGAPFSFTTYAKPASDANAIFMNDLVKKVTGAVALPEAPSFNAPTVQTGYQGTPGTTLWQGVSINFGAASLLTVHQVVDQPDCIFLAQLKTGTVFATSSHGGKNANISTTTAGSTTTRQSGLAIDGATIATTGTLDVRITRIAMISPNAEGDSAILECTINKHELGLQTAGV